MSAKNVLTSFYLTSSMLVMYILAKYSKVLVSFLSSWNFKLIAQFSGLNEFFDSNNRVINYLSGLLKVWEIS